MRPSNKSHILLLPFVILTASIIILSVLAQVLIHRSLNDMKADAILVNTAINQRMLAHQVVNSIAADNLAGQITKPPLDSLQRAFNDGHQAMMHHINGTDTNEIAIKDYGNEYRALDEAYVNFSSVMMMAINSAGADNRDFVQVLDKQSAYVARLDMFVSIVDGNADMKVDKFRRDEMLVTACALLVIALEVILIFLPAVKKIRKQSQQFREIAFHQSHIVRQPLANIKALLNLVDVTKLDEDNKELVQLATQEADKLDAAVKTIVYNTSEE